MRTKSKLTAAALATIATVSTLAYGQNESSTTVIPKAGTAQEKAQAEKLVNTITKGTVTVINTFQGPDGMVAIEGISNKILPNGQRRKLFAWMTPGGGAVIPVPAPLLSDTGVNYTEQALIAMGLQKKPEAPSAVATAVAHGAKTFMVGNNGPIIDVFFDPNCIYCHKLYERALPLIQAGKLQMRVTMVGFLKPSSADKAAAILLTKDPAKALAYNEAHFVKSTEEGGIKPITKQQPATTAAVGSNTGILIKTGQEATPAIVFCDKAGDFKMIHGIPGNEGKFLNHLATSAKSILPDGTCQ
ncbi:MULTISPECIES: thiol:disulfide interchange protein DsbG [Acidithiobacillus]|uniref:Thioredoxin-like fold domain-containing protein n=2 Tax=Acidithiobacillus TaxID=119977 RepID=A0A179BPL3_ACIFR|nr:MULTISPECIES: thiol:disulfide interchange protein DsbG [Acidithiobacillus]MEB8475588.1 thiol:disulfide interchange protein DsbG [Acidithiobacillus ferriphilus]MEB8487408.1 thiol:disulfide interchange protein DsbG [Acidithiobacillus ferriphilus]MEB8490189.1 thiol:disulfide interchange protein DsbG [Acidithiobacillus ferriphilus]MEB8493223.1 thiol:disulfide interchange protein DsbG [Acidithiobacillus ferriphilus]MEB8514887.1 thiol:disulfide interchange protein DsbG [Acidithiobacillus ferriphi